MQQEEVGFIWSVQPLQTVVRYGEALSLFDFWWKMSGSPAPLTWLQAAEYVLREEGPEMHIKDLTSRILELGIVKSNCATSLETLLYRQTSGGGGSQYGGRANPRAVVGPSKFIRVTGKHGWFGLKPSALQEEPDFNISLESIDEVLLDEKNSSDQEMEVDVKCPPPYGQQQLPMKRRNSVHSSDDENMFFLMSSDSEGSSEMWEESSSEEEEEDVGSECSEALYRKKYTFLKKLAKSIVFENVALAEQLTGMQGKIKRMELEREFLFQKLLQFQRVGAARHSVHGHLPFTRAGAKESSPGSVGEDPTRSHPSAYEQPHSQRSRFSPHAPEDIPTTSRRASRQGPLTSRLAPPTSRQAPPTHSGSTKRSRVTSSHEAKRSPLVSAEKQRRNLLLDNSEQSSGEWSDSDKDLVIDTPTSLAPPPIKKEPQAKRKKEAGHGAGPKKQLVAMEEAVDNGEDEELELAMRSGKVRRLHPIALHPDGSPVFPIVVGGLKVMNLGKIVYDRVAYHSERYLLPVGFESQRTYPSMIDPSQKCFYTCRILDGGEAPIFEMVAEDDSGNPVRASSSTACQTIVLKNINKARDKQATNSGSGPEFFGYSNPTILNLLQKMPDAKKCPKYKFVRFAEPSRRGGPKSSGGGQGKARKLNPKSKPQLLKGKKAVTSTSKTVAAKKKLDMESSSSQKGSGIGVNRFQRTDSSPAIAPILGTALEAQYGMDVGALSDTSSDDSSTATDNELIIDS